MRKEKGMFLTVRRSLYPVLVVLLLVACGACTAMKEMGKTVAEMTPKQKAAWMMSSYSDQYDDYLAKVALPNLSNEEKQVLRAKKKVLTTIYPLIQAYDMAVASDRPPTEESTAEIMKLIADLASMVVR